MNNTALNATSFPLCPSLLIKVTSTPYTPSATAQTVTILTCIVNGISCPLAIGENLLVFMVILKKRSLRTTFNTSVLCLAVTDLLIAMFIQPAFIAYQIGKFINSTYLCVPYFIKTVFEFWCVGLSFITLGLITLERYFAVFHLSRRRHAVPRNACNFQRLVVLVCVQLQSTFFSFWNELESLFNCIFHFNYIHAVPNNICLF